MSLKGIFPIDKWDFESKSIFAGLPESDLEILMARKTEGVYKKGEIIFREGIYPSGIYYVIDGKVKKYKVDAEGREQIIYVANSGELLGYHAILSSENYTDSAAVLEESTIAFIPREDFLEALNRSGVLNRRLLKTLSHEFAVLVSPRASEYAGSISTTVLPPLIFISSSPLSLPSLCVFSFSFSPSFQHIFPLST